MDEITANLSYEFTFLLMAVFAFCWLTFVKKERFHPLREKTKFAAALCETAGQFSYVFALSGQRHRGRAPTIASYSIFSALWAPAVLKEKLTKAQYAVIALVMVGHRHPRRGVMPRPLRERLRFSPLSCFFAAPRPPASAACPGKSKDHPRGDGLFSAGGSRLFTFQPEDRASVPPVRPMR